MAESVDDGFAQRGHRDEQFVDPFQAVVFKAPADGQVPVKEGHGFVQQMEGVALILAVVEKLVFVRATEPGQPQGALRIMNPTLGSKQNDGGILQLAADAEFQSIEDFRDVGAGGFRQAAGFDPEPDGAEDFVGVELVDGNLIGFHGFPAVPWMHVLEDARLVLFAGQNGGGGTHPVVRPSVKRERPEPRERGRDQHQHLVSIG